MTGRKFQRIEGFSNIRKSTSFDNIPLDLAPIYKKNLLNKIHIFYNKMPPILSHMPWTKSKEIHVRWNRLTFSKLIFLGNFTFPFKNKLKLYWLIFYQIGWYSPILREQEVGLVHREIQTVETPTRRQPFVVELLQRKTGSLARPDANEA